MLRWFAHAISVHRIYEGPVPESGFGAFAPAHFTVWHLRKGGLDIEIAGHSFPLRAPNWFLLPPMPRKQSALPGTNIFSVHFKLDAAALARLNWPPVLACDARADTLAIEERSQALCAILRRAEIGPSLAYLPAIPLELEQFLKIQASFLRCLETIIEHIDSSLLTIDKRTIDRRVTAARSELQNHALSPLPDLAAISARQGLTLRHLNRLHKQFYDKTFQQFLDECRMDSARSELALPSLTIKEIAYVLGFTDLAAFSNWFRKHELCSPREFRARLQGTQKHW